MVLGGGSKSVGKDPTLCWSKRVKVSSRSMCLFRTESFSCAAEQKWLRNSEVETTNPLTSAIVDLTSSGGTSIFTVKMESQWKNHQRTLVVCSRGVSHQHRHLLNELISLMPHCKKEAKVDKKDQFRAIQDLTEMHSCNNFIYLESRKKYAFLWIGRAPSGPSVKFYLANVHTSKELRFSGNCIKSSRPVLSFNESFSSTSYCALIKQLFIQGFCTPLYHPKSMPFIDHLFSFSCFDNTIFFRNYEIIKEKNEETLVEIGPRFSLIPIKVFDGLLSGETLYKNGAYVTPRVRERANLYSPRKKKKTENSTEDLGVKAVYG